MTKDQRNSFSALGFEADEAVNEALRTDLADIVRGYIERSRKSQTALGKELGIPQSTISAIKNDNIDRLSLEYLLKIVTRAGIPWAAACTNPPHDARWVAGGVSQLEPRTPARNFGAANVSEYWDSVFQNSLMCGYKVGSSSCTTPATPISLTGHNDA